MKQFINTIPHTMFLTLEVPVLETHFQSLSLLLSSQDSSLENVCKSRMLKLRTQSFKAKLYFTVKEPIIMTYSRVSYDVGHFMVINSSTSILIMN